MLEFLLNTLKNNKKKITGVYRRHRRVNMQNKKETDGSSELFYGFALHQQQTKESTYRHTHHKRIF